MCCNSARIFYSNVYVQVIWPDLIDRKHQQFFAFQQEVPVDVETVDYGYKDRGLPR